MKDMLLLPMIDGFVSGFLLFFVGDLIVNADNPATYIFFIVSALLSIFSAILFYFLICRYTKSTLLFLTVSSIFFVIFVALLFFIVMNTRVAFVSAQTPNMAHGLMILFSLSAYVISSIVVRVIILVFLCSNRERDAE